MQLSKQPLTHSILRNSQSRRHSSRPDQQSQQKLKQNDKNIKNKNYNQRLFNYQYSRSCQSRQRVNFNTGDNNSGYLLNSIHKSQYELKQRRQSIVVCQSLPKTRPKYSFTFSNCSSQHNNHKQQSQFNVNKIINNKYNRTPNVQPNNYITQRPLSSPVSHQVNTSQQQQQKQQYQQQQRQYQQQQKKQNQRQQQYQQKRQYQRQQEQLTSRCRNIRKDIDICLYTIADKLNQQRQFQQQSSKQMKQLVASKLGSPQQLKYKPSFSQLRKNKKMFLDKSIHRIHPEIVQQYIETVYREYNLPNVMRGGQQQVKVSGNVYDRESMRQQRRYIVNKQQINQRTTNNIQLNQKILAKKQKLTKIPSQKQQQQRVSFQTRQSQQLKKQQNMTTQTQPIYQSQYILHNTKYVRKNNLISQKQLMKLSINKIQKRRFLNLTLSKQKQDKMLITKNKFQSPTKKVNNNKQQGVRKQQQSRQSSKSSKSQSVKKSSSQRKIMQIKKNIADWRDSQHQFAQRYSYLQSPYEIIRGKQQQQKIKQQQSSRKVNIVVRPFEEMMKVSISKQEKQQIPHAIKTVSTQYITNQTSSHYHNQQQSKYIHSFFTNSEGQIPQQFRYCPLCQQQVLKVNLMKHQQKCIGWIDDCGQLVMFKELYMMDDEKLGELMHVKIKEIQKRVQKFVQKLRLKQQQTAKQQTQNLNTKILRSVEEFIHSYTLLQQNPINLTTKYLLASDYNSLNNISKNDQSFILLEETRKLYWFVGLLESYQNRRKNLIKNKPNTYKSQQIQKYNQSKGDNNVSTMARHNQSVNFIQQQNKNTHVSEFVDVRNSTF